MIDLYMDLLVMFLEFPLTFFPKHNQIKQSELDEFREQWIELNESYRNNPKVIFYGDLDQWTR